MNCDPSHGQCHRRFRPFAVALGLVSLVFVLYWPVTQHEFVNYDDQQYVTHNPQVRAGLTWAGFVWAFTSVHAANWHPLTWLSHMLDCQVWGLWPGGHHLTNVALHAANAVLVWLFLLRATGAFWRSALVAALFAVHPLRVESVAWVAERKDVLSALWGLLALVAYTRYVHTAETGRLPTHDKLSARPSFSAVLAPAGGTRWYVLALACFALSLMSKPMLVTLPFLLLLLDWWPFNRLKFAAALSRRSIPGRLVGEKWPFFVLAFASCGVTLAAQQGAMGLHRQLGFDERLANAVVSVARYLGKTLWPAELATPYPHPGHWPAATVVLSAIVVVSLTVVVLWRARGQPFMVVGWLWFLGLLVPVLGLVQVGVAAMADRYTYLPHVGLLILIIWTAGEVVATRSRLLPVAAMGGGLALVLCSLVTRYQVQIWRDTESLFTHAIRVTEQNWVAHYNLALLFMDRYQTAHRGELSRQGAETATAVVAHPRESSPPALLELVIQHCRAALVARPRFADIHVTLAKALTENSRLAEAHAQLTTALELAPDNAEARQNLAEVLHRLGRSREAIVQFERALELQPDWAPVLNNLAWLRATHREAELRDGGQAVALAQRACDLTGATNFWYLQTLAAAYAEAGQPGQALAWAGKARELAIQSGSPDMIKRAEARLELFQAGGQVRE